MSRPISLAGAIFSGAGAILLVATAITLWYTLRPLQWPSVQATVTTSRVLGDQNAMYRAERGFRYTVGDEEYAVVDSASWSSSSYKMVEREVAAFPEGARREIKVNPGDPRDVSTTTRVTLTALIAPIALFVLTIVFGGIGIWALRPSFSSPRKVIFERALGAEEIFGAARSQAKFPTRLFAWVFVPVGLVFLTIAALLLKRQIDEAGWPKVSAEVTQSAVRAGRSRGARYTPWIEFRYVVGAREYVTPTSGSVWTSSRSDVEAKIERFSPGSRHEIRHDPLHPEIVRYQSPLSLMGLFLPIGMGVGALVFLGFGIAIPRVFRGM